MLNRWVSSPEEDGDWEIGTELCQQDEDSLLYTNNRQSCQILAEINLCQDWLE